MESSVFKVIKNLGHSLCLSILLAVAIPLTAFAQMPLGIPPEVKNLPAEMQALPMVIKAWYVYETVYLSRESDPIKLKPLTQNDQDPFYAPEAMNVFDLVGLWIPEDLMKIYQTEKPSEISNQFKRIKNGKKEFLFLIHPESRGLYQDLIKKNYDQETFRAVATASSRSLLTWKKGKETKPFIAKVSLDKTLGHVNRAIKGVETAMSVGVSATIEGSKDLPTSAVFMNESLSMIPKDRERGGMIIRTFPPEFLNGESVFLPLFALYGGEKRGILPELILNSGMAPEKFIEQKIIRPFIEMWTTLAVEHGIIMEPHAQNMLIEIKDGKLTGRFGLRDYGGFNIDFEYRKSVRKYVPLNLPTFTGDIKKDYYADTHIKNLVKSLRSYFEGGFLYNVTNKMNDWADMGFIPRMKYGDYYLTDALIDQIEAALVKRVNSRVRINHAYEGLIDSVQEARREYRRELPPLTCQQVF